MTHYESSVALACKEGLSGMRHLHTTSVALKELNGMYDGEPVFEDSYPEYSLFRFPPPFVVFGAVASVRKVIAEVNRGLIEGMVDCR